MEARDFAQKFLLEEVKKMEAANVPLHLLLAIVQGMETAGALLDDKPFKAKGQGKKRFQFTLRKLFPKPYSEANNRLDLYSQLRSHMAHCMLPATSIVVVTDADNHLAFDSENRLQLCPRSFFTDYENAILALLEKLDSGELQNKKVLFDGLNEL
ncbi:MAG: hypothetical protein GC178_11145 [Flavobacteriales bacterium]|nr:hypothetical protein [Flavobacteriales bacterium]